jgi:hypothetical protein
VTGKNLSLALQTVLRIQLSRSSVHQQTALEVTGLLSLLNPKQELSPLGEYAVPAFHQCETHHSIAAQADRRRQSGLRVWRRHTPTVLSHKLWPVDALAGQLSLAVEASR